LGSRPRPQRCKCRRKAEKTKGVRWWGAYGTYPGAWWELHQFSVDAEGNFYGADSFNGRTQKFTPKPGGDKNRLMGQIVR
jgi:hypothetical protein